jgi:hypothetical protein
MKGSCSYYSEAEITKVIWPTIFSTKQKYTEKLIESENLGLHLASDLIKYDDENLDIDYLYFKGTSMSYSIHLMHDEAKNDDEK